MKFFGELRRVFGGLMPSEGSDARYRLPVRGFAKPFTQAEAETTAAMEEFRKKQYLSTGWPKFTVPASVEREQGHVPPRPVPLAASFKPSNPKDVMGISKAPMSTVSQLVLAEVGVAMLEGALKYGRHNYRGVGVLASIYFDATMRHLRSWWEGEDVDKASQLSHITKAITSLIVLRDAMIMDKFTDDRPPAHPDIAGFLEDLDRRAAALAKRDEHIRPKHYTNLNK